MQVVKYRNFLMRNTIIIVIIIDEINRMDFLCEKKDSLFAMDRRSKK